VLHEHHLIICVGAGLIQFVYGSHSRMAADLTLDKNLFSLPFSRNIQTPGYLLALLRELSQCPWALTENFMPKQVRKMNLDMFLVPFQKKGWKIDHHAKNSWLSLSRGLVNIN